MVQKRLSPSETARRLGIGLELVYKYLWAGKLEGSKQDGRWLVSFDSVQRRIKKSKTAKEVTQ